ncbi:response regulator [Polymorphobacter fuscus]|uniref:Response regulator n=2 Tax=Sandarakinorhabdus fusca TaxID=1439888 RepID=A0A7C9KYE3_9SPHN|nr:response regulator transcription factor [Polymorphobacter fuscus]KAB7644499.1 response regulator transcription factor [Polymorphobacter fuscus]MQT18322.1 response regulator [Polymorphobacter fuscus]
MTADETPCPPIRLLLVDDHPMLRDGIAALVDRETDMEVVGEAANGTDAIAMFEALAPDVTLMDVQMPGLSGIGAIEAIMQASPEARILVLTTYPGDAQALRAIRAGAAGYLLKNCIRKDLLDAIRSLHSGGRAMSAEVAHTLAAHSLNDHLTPRELSVLKLVAEGHPNKQIAWKLELSMDTIKAHLKSAFAKLGVDDRTHAVTIARRRGYIDP